MVAVLSACGVLFENALDTNGASAYACLATKRYFGYQIFLDISRLTKHFLSIPSGLDDRSLLYLLENRKECAWYKSYVPLM
jgi:hypothetical protein